MFRLVGLLQRSPNLSHDEFVNYWRMYHAPLASRVPGLQRYEIAPIASLHDGSPAPWDGIGELWFSSREAWLSALTTVEWKATQDDLVNFKTGGPIFTCDYEYRIVP